MVTVSFTDYMKKKKEGASSVAAPTSDRNQSTSSDLMDFKQYMNQRTGKPLSYVDTPSLAAPSAVAPEKKMYTQDEILSGYDASYKEYTGYNGALERTMKSLGATAETMWGALIQKHGAVKGKSGKWEFQTQAQLDAYNADAQRLDSLISHVNTSAGVAQKWSDEWGIYKTLQDTQDQLDSEVEMIRLSEIESKRKGLQPKAQASIVQNAQANVAKTVAGRSGNHTGVKKAQVEIDTDRRAQESARMQAQAQIAELDREEAQIKKTQELRMYRNAPSQADFKEYAEKGKSDPANKVARVRANPASVRDHSAEDGNTEAVRDAGYVDMTQQEFDLYNYIFGKYGAERAQTYLDMWQTAYDQEKGKAIADRIDSVNIPIVREALTYGFQAVAGAEGFVRNVAGLTTDRELSSGASQYASGELISRTGERGLLGQVDKFLQQGANTVGNMLPAILLGKGAGLVAQGAGASAGAVAKTAAAVSSLSMGAGAAGGAYQQALREGYTQSQARVYGLLVGASETGLSMLLSGVGANVGLAEEKLLTKAGGLDKAWKRVLATGAVRVGSELVEEELQLFIEPAIKNAVLGVPYDAPGWEEMVETAVVTAVATGLMEGVSVADARFDAVARAVAGDIARNPAILDGLLDNAVASYPDSKTAKIAAELAKKRAEGKKVSETDVKKFLTAYHTEAKAKHETQQAVDEAQSAKNAVSGEETAVTVKSGQSAINERSQEKQTLAYTLATNLDKVRDMEPVSQLTGREMNERSKTIPEQISEFFKSLGNKVFRNGLGDVELGEYGVGGIMNHKPINRAKLVSLAAVPDVIQNGRQIGYDPNWKGRGYPSYIFAAPVMVGDTEVFVAAVVDQRPDNKFYLSEMVDSEGNYVRIEESPSSNSKNGVTEGAGQASGAGVTAGPEGLSMEGNPLSEAPNPLPSVNTNIPQPANSVNSGAAVSDQQAAKNVAQVREYATIFGEHGSKALAAAYDETTAKLVSVQDAQAGFFAAYTAARDGKTLSAEEQHSVAKLTPGLRFAAETAGEADALRANQAVYFGKDAKLVEDDMLKRANLRSKDRRMLDAIAKNAGIKVRIVEKLVDERGYAADAQYKDGELLISLEAKDPVRAAFIHDLVHRIRVVSPEAYTTLASFVRDNMSRDNWNALVKGEAFRYGERGLDYLSEEMVARAFGTLMGDSALLDQFVKDNRNPGQIILDAIKDMIAAIKRALNGQNVKLTAEQKADFAELQADLEGMSKALEKALKQMEADVKRNTKEGNKNTASEGGEVKYSLMYEEAIDKLHANNLDRENNTHLLVLDHTPDIYIQKAGAKNLKIITGWDTAYLAMNANGELQGNYHSLGADVMKGIPEALEDPLYIVKQKDGRIIAITEVLRKNRPVLVSVELDTFKTITKEGKRENENYNLIVTFFDAQTNYLKNKVFVGEVKYNKNDEDPAHFISRLKSLKKALPTNDHAESSGDNVPQTVSGVKGEGLSRSSLTLASDPTTTELIQENTRLKEQVEKWKGQTKRTTTPTLRQGDVDKLARQIVKDYDGTLDWHDIAGDVKALGEFILRGGEELTWSEVKERAMDIGRKIVNSAQVLVDGELEQDLNGLKGYLRNVKLAYEDNGDIPDFNDWRKRHYGKFTISKDGLPVDVAYQELQGAFGEVYFPADITHPSDQLMHIAQLLDDMQSVMENPYSADMEQAIQHAANALIDGLLSEQVRQSPPTFADKQAAKLDKVKAKSRESTKRQLDRVRADRDAKLEQLKEKHRAKDKAGRERQTASELRRKIGKHVSKLSQKLLKPNNEQHVPEDLRGAVAAMLEAINLEGPYTIDPETGKRVKNGGGEPTKRTAAFEKLREEYRKALLEITLTEDPDLLGEDGNLAKVIGMRDIRLSDMNTEQLETVWKTIRAVEKSITNANKLLAGEKAMALDELAQELREDNKGKSAKAEYNYIGGLQKLTGLDMMTPETFLHRLGSAGDAIFRMMRNAQDEHIRIMKKTADFTHEVLADINVRKLEKELHTVTLGGEEVTLSTAQLMELYVLMRREQAQNHIYKGGILPDAVSGKGLKKNIRTEAVQGISEQEVQVALELLTDEQMELAEKLQNYASDDLSGYGNRASMSVYGYKKFNEKNYWPIRSNRHETHSDIQKDTQVTTVANRGFTKAVKPNANTSVCIGSIFDTFATHASEMATYAAWLEVTEDINRIRNFVFRDKDGNRTGSVKGIIDRVHGSKGSDYLNKLLGDIANGVKSTHGQTEYMGRIVGNYKASAVGSNLRVVIQQPTAILRAMDMIDPKYLVMGMKPGDGWKKALKYAPIAQWKDWGYFDINTGRQMKDVLFDSASRLEKMRQGSMWLAGKMDSLTWGQLWNACELEVRERWGKSNGPTWEELAAKDPIKVVELDENAEGLSYAQLKARALKRAENEGWFKRPHQNRDTGTAVFVNKETYTHAFSNLKAAFGEDTILAMEHLPELIEEAVLTHAEGPKDPTKSETQVYTLFAAVRGKNGVEPVKLKVKEYDSFGGQILPENVREFFKKNGTADKYSRLYDVVAIELESTKKEPGASGEVYSHYGNDALTTPDSLDETDASASGYDHEGPQAKGTPVSEISVADLLDLVNGDARKYIPEPEGAPDTETFYRAVAERFTQIIDHTQVVDGILQRSQIMRDPSALAKMATSFMGEPTKQYNMMMYAVYDAKNGSKEQRSAGRKRLARAAFALGVAGVVNAAAASIIDAIRDDDKEEEYWEKWLEAFEDNLANLVNPAVYVPYVKDVISLIQGYDVSRMDMESIEKTIRAAGNFGKALDGQGKYTIQGAGANFFFELARLPGISVANLKRDIHAFVMLWAVETNNYLMQYHIEKFWNNLKYSNNSGTFMDILYNAYVNDREAYEIIYADMVKSGYDADKIKSGMETRMKKAQGVESVADLKERYLAPEQSKQYEQGRKKLAGSALWKKATVQQREAAEDDLYEMIAGTDGGERHKEKVSGGAAYGLNETEYLLYRLALSMADEPNDSGGMGTYTNAEVERAIDMVSGLTDAERSYLWLAQGKHPTSNPYD